MKFLDEATNVFKKVVTRSDCTALDEAKDSLRQASDIHLLETGNATKQALNKIENDLETAKRMDKLTERLMKGSK